MRYFRLITKWRSMMSQEEAEMRSGAEPDQSKSLLSSVIGGLRAFVNNLLGEKETKDSVDENMNTSSVTHNTGEPNWNKESDMNFLRATSMVYEEALVQIENEKNTGSNWLLRRRSLNF